MEFIKVRLAAVRVAALTIALVQPSFQNFQSLSTRHGSDVPRGLDEETLVSQTLATERNEECALNSGQNTSQNCDDADSTFYEYFDGDIGQILKLTTENISECFNKRSLLNFETNEGEVSFHSKNMEKAGDNGPVACVLRVTGVVNTSILIDFHQIDVTCALSVIVRDAALRNYRHIATVSCHNPLSRVYSNTNDVVFLLKANSLKESVSLNFSFAAVGDDMRDSLEVIYTSPTSGYVQTPNWDGVATYPQNMYSKVRVDVPENYRLLVSFLSMDVDNQRTKHEKSPYLASCGEERAVLRFDGRYMSHFASLCRTRRPEPILISARLFEVAFVSDQHEDRDTGFRLLFTFHNQSALPEKDPETGKWNCSVPYWSDFKKHFPCDLTVDCAGGEDEAPCPYISDKCGEGQVWSGSSCFVNLGHSMQVGWRNAAFNCSHIGGRLPSLNTKKKLDDFVQLMQRLRVHSHSSGTGDVYIGLRPVDPFTPHMYRRNLRWTDGSIAYFLPPRGVDVDDDLDTSVCTFVSSRGYYFRTNCFLSARSLYVLCEMPTQESREAFEPSEQNKTNLKGPNEAPNRTDSQGKMSSAYTEQVSHTTNGRDSEPHLPPVVRLQNEAKPAHGFGKEDQMDTRYIVAPIAISEPVTNSKFVVCPANHTTHTFLACDVQSACWGKDYGDLYTCQTSLRPLPVLFMCANQHERVPYTLVCDYRAHCSDDSDESFCVFDACDALEQFDCGDRQCIAKSQRCDGRADCLNDADEVMCSFVNAPSSDNIDHASSPPAIVTLDDRGNFIVTPLSQNMSCPETHFQCPVFPYCLPVYLRCNGVHDCPGQEDEMDCDTFTCPGYYRCRSSNLCVHPNDLCDGVAQCPQQDDELVCDVTCPSSCTCYGLAFYCVQPFTAADHTQLRFLDAEGTGMTLADVSANTRLVSLSLADCGLEQLHNVSLPNLVSLNLSYNNLKEVSAEVLNRLHNLKFLSLAANPLATYLGGKSALELSLPSLHTLDLSEIPLPELDDKIFTVFPNLQVLNLSECGVDRLLGNGFQTLKQLQVVDLRGCPLTTFTDKIFTGLQRLESVLADNYKLCCPQTLPKDFYITNCHAPSDEVSSCETLLRSDFYRVLLSVFCTLALLGNLGSFGYRLFVDRGRAKQGFAVFVTHLCVADFLMGVYLAIIGVADRIYFGAYLWNDSAWKNSVACKVAGFLSLLSSEVSAINICLITADRFIVLRFPFSHVRFHRRSAHVACGLAWIVGLILAAIPLLPATSEWRFYSQSGICIPLPITRTSFLGHKYSFSVLIVLNFVLFVAIAVGQVFVFWSIRSNSLPMSSLHKKAKDLTIARRLLSVALSDFLCWFPIGLLGFMARSGTPIPGEVNVAMAIIALPLNSALNPFLYTVNMVLESRRRAKEEQLHKVFLASVERDM